MAPATIPNVQDLETKFLSDIDKEMEKLRPAHEEYEKLAEMRERMVGRATVRVNGRNAPRAGGAGTRRRAGVDRREQFLQVVRDNPGITIPQIAEKIEDVQPNYLYRVRTKAEADGLVRQENPGGKLFATDAA